ncbi:hypothetical protein EZV62_026901 [Acer yangbiense]|uniref:Leucine-rich repeat-containing N-terminal plant-type domain-containing protein n=1 Tax=Acer yangbiense TaxID=1000413 RepID=A0A5C7GSZ4_9ROSI|nr:hypothetical protein EZV62_026901 [Acer yangbiense]
MWNNNLQGSILEEIGKLTNLKTFNLCGNQQISGTIPPTIFNISSFNTIDFALSRLSSNLPEDMCQYLPVLQRPIHHHNQLEGPIPSSLGQCRELLRIPRNIVNLSLLQELYLDTNDLKGELPEELGSLLALERLRAGESHITESSLSPNVHRQILHSQVVGEQHGEEAKDDNVAYINKEKPPIKMYDLLLNLAFGALAEKEFKLDKSNFWEEPYQQASVWNPCADRRTPNIAMYGKDPSMLDKQLLRNFIPNFPSKHQNIARGLSSYLALHLIFEEDMVAYSQCDFRDGKDERNELNFKHTMKSISLDLLMERLKKSKNIKDPVEGSRESCRDHRFYKDSYNANKMQLKVFVTRQPISAYINTDGDFKQHTIGIYNGNCRDSINHAVDVDAPLQSGLVHVFEQPGIEAPSDEDDFIEAAATNITTDQYALLALKDRIKYDPTNLLAKNWSTSSSICTWIGVTCGVRHHRVTILNISYFGLSGTIPPQLGNLSFLQVLDFGNNSFSGSLPDELAQLRRLKRINFMFNIFQVEIPSWFGTLSKLQYLLLSRNNLVGTIPPSLGNMSSLQVLDLSDNQLSGTIPSSIFQISSLESLFLSHNQLSGSFPSIIFTLPSLQDIGFAYNSLSGGLPSHIFNYLPNLKQLFLDNNMFDGQIPSTISKWQQLQTLFLSYNNFTGYIPKEIGNMTMLKELHLETNFLQGMM